MFPKSRSMIYNLGSARASKASANCKAELYIQPAFVHIKELLRNGLMSCCIRFLRLLDVCGAAKDASLQTRELHMSFNQLWA